MASMRIRFAFQTFIGFYCFDLFDLGWYNDCFQCILLIVLPLTCRDHFKREKNKILINSNQKRVIETFIKFETARSWFTYFFFLFLFSFVAINWSSRLFQNSFSFHNFLERKLILSIEVIQILTDKNSNIVISNVTISVFTSRSSSEWRSCRLQIKFLKFLNESHNWINIKCEEKKKIENALSHHSARNLAQYWLIDWTVPKIEMEECLIGVYWILFSMCYCQSSNCASLQRQLFVENEANRKKNWKKIRINDNDALSR